MRKIANLLLAALLLLPAPAVLAEDAPLAFTRTVAPEAPRPKASLAELGWLVGEWQGPGISGAASQETWSTPLGGLMAGSFVQGDGKGGVMFSEFMQIAPDGESLVMRLKHFNADLTGWEEKDKSVAFRLIAREGDSWYFNGLTYRREGRDRMLVAVRMRGKDGALSELVFRFQRQQLHAASLLKASASAYLPFAPEKREFALDFPTTKQVRRTLPNDKEFLGLSGAVTNLSDASRALPVILVILRDANEQIVFSQTITGQQERLGPGETAQIDAALTEFPKSAKVVEIGWKPD